MLTVCNAESKTGYITAFPDLRKLLTGKNLARLGITGVALLSTAFAAKGPEAAEFLRQVFNLPPPSGPVRDMLPEDESTPQATRHWMEVVATNTPTRFFVVPTSPSPTEPPPTPNPSPTEPPKTQTPQASVTPAQFNRSTEGEPTDKPDAKQNMLEPYEKDWGEFTQVVQFVLDPRFNEPDAPLHITSIGVAEEHKDQFMEAILYGHYLVWKLNENKGNVTFEEYLAMYKDSSINLSYRAVDTSSGIASKVTEEKVDPRKPTKLILYRFADHGVSLGKVQGVGGTSVDTTIGNDGSLTVGAVLHDAIRKQSTWENSDSDNTTYAITGAFGLMTIPQELFRVRPDGQRIYDTNVWIQNRSLNEGRYPSSDQYGKFTDKFVVSQNGELRTILSFSN